MTPNRDTLLSIGQFAALHQINKKTLMWYDEIGLFRPAVIGENGYRYYSYYQSTILSTILMLRELNVSIPEIQKFIGNRSASSLEELLAVKVAEIDRDIQRLRVIKQALDHRRKDLSTLLDIDLSEIRMVEREKQYVAVVETPPTATLDQEIEMVVDAAKKYQIARLHDATCGSLIAVEHLYGGEFQRYAGIFIRIPNPTAKKDLHLQPGGRYLQAFFQGSWDGLPDRYLQILDWAENRGIQLCGYAYETGINEAVIQSVDQYITQIEIPIAPC